MLDEKSWVGQAPRVAAAVPGVNWVLRPIVQSQTELETSWSPFWM